MSRSEAVENLVGLGHIVDRQDELAGDLPSRVTRSMKSARVKGANGVLLHYVPTR
jgi:hypothetical protein